MLTIEKKLKDSVFMNVKLLMTSKSHLFVETSLPPFHLHYFREIMTCLNLYSNVSKYLYEKHFSTHLVLIKGVTNSVNVSATP